MAQDTFLYDPRVWATNILEQLKGPIPAVYADVREFLWDFWPDMPWTPTMGSRVASVILLDDELRHIVRAFDVRNGIDGQANAIEFGMMQYAAQNFD